MRWRVKCAKRRAAFARHGREAHSAFSRVSEKWRRDVVRRRGSTTRAEAYPRAPIQSLQETRRASRGASDVSHNRRSSNSRCQSIQFLISRLEWSLRTTQVPDNNMEIAKKQMAPLELYFEGSKLGPRIFLTSCIRIPTVLPPRLLVSRGRWTKE